MDEEIQQPLFDEAVMAVVAPAAPVTSAQEAGHTGEEEIDDELRAALSASNSNEVTPEQIDLIMARKEAWLEDNADPITIEEFAAIFHQLKLFAPDIPLDPDTAQGNQIRILFHLLWKEHRVIFAMNTRFYRARRDPPRWLMVILDLIDDKSPVKRPLRPIISPAFRHDGREGLGRISSSQINQGIFAACIAPKGTWGKTAKGFPRYTHIVPTGEIEITLRPEIEVKDAEKLAKQITDMETIRDELSISDWDMACILMEQSLTENGGHGMAYISDADACDYRKLEKNRKDGFAAGHHPDNRKRASDAINRLVHLWIRTDTLRVRQVDDKGKLSDVTANWREKFVTIRQTLDRQDSEATIGWYYEFGRSFTTFLQRPNHYIAYLLQATIALKASQESAKIVAHYIALRLRIDAQHGPAYDLAMGNLVGAVHLPYNEARAKETIQMNEATLRTCVKAGLFRIKTKDGDVLHATTPLTQLKAWTLAPQNLRGKALLKEWKRQKVIILAVPDIEQRYDRVRKNGRGREQIAGR